MKKLMIAAAAAAMIGGVQAATDTFATYNFSAYLTTTTSAEATTADTPASTTTEEYTLMAASKPGVTPKAYWYDDPVVTNLLDQTLLTAKPKKYVWADESKYGELEWEMVLEGTPWAHPNLKIPSQVVTNADAMAFLTNSFWAAYQNNSEVCLDLYWIHQETTPVVPGQFVCYRVASGEYINQEVALATNCCVVGSALGKSFYVVANDIGIMKSEVIDPVFMYRFGMPTSKDARMVEIYANVSNVLTTSHMDWDVTAKKYIERGLRPFEGQLAGQGWSQELDVDGTSYLLPVSISGNIVGKLPAAECLCCVPNLPTSLAFDCMTDTAVPTGLTGVSPTAAYGWFYIQWTGYKTGLYY